MKRLNFTFSFFLNEFRSFASPVFVYLLEFEVMVRSGAMVICTGEVKGRHSMIGCCIGGAAGVCRE